MSITQAGPTNFAGGMRSTELSGRSFPEIQWTGASKWVPVCSPVSNPFQYQAGPRSSYRDSSQILNAGVLFHCDGSGSKGVCGVNGCVRSTTRSRPAISSSSRFAKTRDMGASLQVVRFGLLSLDRDRNDAERILSASFFGATEYACGTETDSPTMTGR